MAYRIPLVFSPATSAGLTGRLRPLGMADAGKQEGAALVAHRRWPPLPHKKRRKEDMRHTPLDCGRFGELGQILRVLMESDRFS